MHVLRYSKSSEAENIDKIMKKILFIVLTCIMKYKKLFYKKYLLVYEVIFILLMLNIYPMRANLIVCHVIIW